MHQQVRTGLQNTRLCNQICYLLPAGSRCDPVCIWVSLQQGARPENPQSPMRTDWSCLPDIFVCTGVESAARQLPDSFCVAYGNSQASNTRLRVALQRQLDTELLDSQRIRAAAARAAAAGSSSALAAATAADASSADAWRMSYGAALAQGRPLLLSLSVPVWVVNGTQLPISIGIVPHATTVNGDGSSLATSGDAPGLGEAGLLGSGAAAAGQLRVVDTEAYSQITRPGGHVTIMGNSVELLSFPGEGPDGSAWGASSAGGSSSGGSQLGGARAGISSSLEQAGLSSGVVQQWAAVISVMGSRWSSPLVLAAAGSEGAGPGAAGEAAAPVAEAVARLPRYEPVLLRARCRDGCVYEVTVRIESAGSSLPLSTVVRLDPHMVVSNRTGYTLHLLQPEPIWKALGASVTGPAGGALSSSRSSASPGAWFMADAAGGAAAASAQRRGPPTAASATPVRDATLVLRAGSLAVPLSWPQGCVRRLLLLTLPPTPAVMGAAAAAAAASNVLEAVDPVMWSEAFRVDYPATGVMQVLLPLYRLGTPGEPAPVNEESMAAAYAAFDSLLQQAPHQQQQQAKADAIAAATAGRPPLPSRPGSGGGARISSSTSSRSADQPELAAAVQTKPLLVHVAKRTEGGLLEYLAVTVNLAVEMPAPGCLHLVLQSLGGEPQQCLMNCTAAPISYRQATPKAAWQILPPFSGAALVLLQPAGGLGGLLGASTTSGDSSSSSLLTGSAEVELRDTDPATSGSAVCSLDTDSSGLAISQSAGKRSSSSGGAQGAELPATFAIAGGKAHALAQVRQLRGWLLISHSLAWPTLPPTTYKWEC
jgi:vacuolar protein sorting-associated protein 13A/C